MRAWSLVFETPVDTHFLKGQSSVQWNTFPSLACSHIECRKRSAGEARRHAAQPRNEPAEVGERSSLAKVRFIANVSSHMADTTVFTELAKLVPVLLGGLLAIGGGLASQ